LIIMMDKLRIYFTIQGVLAIITLAVLVIGFLAGGGALLSIFQMLR